MNEENKVLLKQLTDRINAVKHLRNRNMRIDSVKNELGAKIGQMVSFINKDVIGKNTSSLIRTDLVIRTHTYGNGKTDYILTINSGGLGTIQKQENGKYTYGTYRSSILQTSDFISYINDEDLRKRTIDFLEENKNKKMKSVMELVFSQAEAIMGLAELGQRYSDRQSYTTQEFPEDITISVPSVGERRENERKIEYKELIIGKASMSRGTEITLSGRYTKIEDRRYGGYKEEGKDITALDYDRIEGMMVAIQIHDDLDKLYTAHDEKLKNDVEKMKKIENELNNVFAVYRLAKEMQQ